MRDRRDVLDRLDVEATGCERADRRLTAGSRPLHLHVDAPDTVLLRQLRRVLRRNLRRERRSLAGALETDAPGAPEPIQPPLEAAAVRRATRE